MCGIFHGYTAFVMKAQKIWITRGVAKFDFDFLEYHNFQHLEIEILQLNMKKKHILQYNTYSVRIATPITDELRVS